MNGIWTEIVIVAVLLCINGLFAMTEIAVVSSRKARLRQMAGRGRSGAKIALELAESPNRFLATVQIGITLVGILAGAFGGATLAEALGDYLGTIPRLAPYADSIALGAVVLAITYLSLVIGELVPKRIGLGHPEQVAALVAKPMHVLSILSAPAVKVLSVSTEVLLRIFRFRASSGTAVTEEEIQVLMQEGLRSGAFNKVESQIVHSALELDQLEVSDLMTPRLKIAWINKDEPHETLWRKIVVSGHSFFPVYDGTKDNVVGLVSVKALYAHLAAGLPVRVPDLMVPPVIVPWTQGVLQLLETLRTKGTHVALVADEYGGIDGLVTLDDVMQAILGDFTTSEQRLQPEAREHGEGHWLVDGMLPLDQLEEYLPSLAIDEEDLADIQTLAGFVMKRVGRVPIEGDRFDFGGYQFEVIDMDRHRVDKILISPTSESPKSE